MRLAVNMNIVRQNPDSKGQQMKLAEKVVISEREDIVLPTSFRLCDGCL